MTKIQDPNKQALKYAYILYQIEMNKIRPERRNSAQESCDEIDNDNYNSNQ